MFMLSDFVFIINMYFRVKYVKNLQYYRLLIKCIVLQIIKNCWFMYLLVVKYIVFLYMKKKYISYKN